ncbi:MAG: sulfatase [Haliscomenobacter sp.]|nr:sulfatase [Haliscomenobacter sp.]
MIIGWLVYSFLIGWLAWVPSQNENPPRPNILFCLADDVSYPYMSAYGCEWVRTPGFDRVAREGLLFQRAYTPNSKCSPSRSCILTGRNSWQLEEAANHYGFFPSKFLTYVEALSHKGYFVGSTGKAWAPGNQGTRNGQPRQLAGPPFNARKSIPPTSDISETDYAANFALFLDQVPSDHPWCFWYGGNEAHRGFRFRSGSANGGKRPEEIPRIPEFWPDTDSVRQDLLDMAYETEHFDLHLQRMLEELDRRGQLGNTLIVVTADNGLAFPRIKGQAYELSNHMPLAMMWKKGIAFPGRVIDDMVSFIDFAPTFLELARVDVKETGMSPVTGKSLTYLFQRPESGQIDPKRNVVLLGKERHDIGRPGNVGYPIRGILRDSFLYLINFEPSRWPAGNPETGYLNCDGSPTKTLILNARREGRETKWWDWCFGQRPEEELYLISRDPDCVSNLAYSTQHQKIKDKLRAELFRQLRRQKDPRMKGQGYLFDAYPYAGKETANFYARYLRGEPMRANWVNETDYEK